MHRLLLLLVFVSGMTSMAVEMCASRLLAPYFGTSLFIWANLIGLVLIYLSVGYFLGGKIADRYPTPRVLCACTSIAAIGIALIPFTSSGILAWSITGLTEASVSVFYSSLLAVILLFAVPVTLLGLVSPFAIRIRTQGVKSAGRNSGSIYALSTLGSILGTFLPVFVFIPTFGTKRTFLGFAAALFLASLWGIWPRLRFLGLPMIVLVVVPLGPLKAIPNLIYYQESPYNYIQVAQLHGGVRELILNEGEAIHSIYSPHAILTGWYWDYFLAAPFFNPGIHPQQVRRIAIIGLAAGTIARQFTTVYGPIPIDGVEIDPAIVAVGRRYFAMTEPNLHVYTLDGRTFMRTTHQRYNVVVIDAFQQPYIPFQLTTREFFQEIRAHLAPDGVVALNTGHTATDYRLVQAFVNTLSQVFPSVYVFDVPGTFNAEVMATMKTTNVATFVQNMLRFPPGSLLGQVAAEVVPQVQQAHPDGGIVFTDDRAPVEQLTDQLLIDYIQHHR
jgi:spermidine synthase